MKKLTNEESYIEINVDWSSKKIKKFFTENNLDKPIIDKIHNRLIIPEIDVKSAKFLLERNAKRLLIDDEERSKM